MRSLQNQSLCCDLSFPNQGVWHLLHCESKSSLSTSLFSSIPNVRHAWGEYHTPRGTIRVRGVTETPAQDQEDRLSQHVRTLSLQHSTGGVDDRTSGICDVADWLHIVFNGAHGRLVEQWSGEGLHDPSCPGRDHHYSRTCILDRHVEEWDSKTGSVATSEAGGTGSHC